MRDTLPTELETSAGDPRKALLQVAEAISLHRDLPALFRDLAQRLPAVAPFDFIGLVLHDPAKQVMKVHVLETVEALGGNEPTGRHGNSDGGVRQRLGLVASAAVDDPVAGR
jgi:hypothetical protein